MGIETPSFDPEDGNEGPLANILRQAMHGEVNVTFPDPESGINRIRRQIKGGVQGRFYYLGDTALTEAEPPQSS